MMLHVIVKLVTVFLVGHNKVIVISIKVKYLKVVIGWFSHMNQFSDNGDIVTYNLARLCQMIPIFS